MLFSGREAAEALIFGVLPARPQACRPLLMARLLAAGATAAATVATAIDALATQRHRTLEEVHLGLMVLQLRSTFGRSMCHTPLLKRRGIRCGRKCPWHKGLCPAVLPIAMRV